MMKEKKLFLLDAYALIYRAYYAFINNPIYNSKGFNTSTVFGFFNALEEIIRTQNPDFIAVAFDSHGPTLGIKYFPNTKQTGLRLLKK
jgi:DNA polymerase I